MLGLVLCIQAPCRGLFPSLEVHAYTERSATVNASSLNVRSGPGTSYSLAGKLTRGAAITVIDEAAASDGTLWYQIRFTGSGGSAVTGYVSSSYVRFPVSYSYESGFEDYLVQQRFPESYKDALRQLHAQYPKWVFEAQHTGLDWNTVIENESVLGRNLVYTGNVSSHKSTADGAYNWDNGTWTGFDGSSWVAASGDIIRYYMDPRNFLNETSVFQFLNHQYDANLHTREGLAEMVKGTFLEGAVIYEGSGSGSQGQDVSYGPGGSQSHSSGVVVSPGASGSSSGGPGVVQTPIASISKKDVPLVGTSMEVVIGAAPGSGDAASGNSDTSSGSGGSSSGSSNSPSGNGGSATVTVGASAQPGTSASGGSATVTVGAGGSSENPSSGSTSSGTVTAGGAVQGSAVPGTVTAGSASGPQVSPTPGISSQSGTSATPGMPVSGDAGSSNYVDIIMKAAQQTGLNPYVIASMIIQEQGKDGRGNSVSGTVSGYEGYYNYFNVGAYASNGLTAVQRGLWYASQSGDYGRPWNTPEKAIIGGAQFYTTNYVNAGQDTFYLKKYNVQGSNLYKHQYMTNVDGADAEANHFAGGYSAQLKNTALHFKIPVFENMPESPCAKPVQDGSPNNKLSYLGVDGFTLTPTFSRDVTSYDLIVDPSVSSASVQASAIDGKAAVSGTGMIQLQSGINDIRISVTAENGAVREYVIHVVRQSNGPTYDSGLSTGTGSGGGVSGPAASGVPGTSAVPGGTSQGVAAQGGTTQSMPGQSGGPGMSGSGGAVVSPSGGTSGSPTPGGSNVIVIGA